MAEQLAKAHQYEYRATANLVLQADRYEHQPTAWPRCPGRPLTGHALVPRRCTSGRRLVSRRTDEGTGEVESLAGRIDPKQMGDRAMRTKPNVDRARQSCVARRRTKAPMQRIAEG